MTISHQKVLDEEGRPVAAQIPWDEFILIQDRLSEVDDKLPLSREWKEELDRRSRELDDGTVEGIPHEEMMRQVRDRVAKASADRSDR